MAPLADYLAESNETLRIDLSNLSDPVSAAGFEDRDNDPLTDDSHADATIVEDPPPEFSVSDFTGKEGTEQVFTVTLANPRAGETATVAYTIGGGTATAPGTGVTLHDYMPKSGTPLACSATGPLTGTLSFTSGTTQDVTVCLHRDAIIESDETVRLTLSSPTNSVIKDHDTLTAGLQAFVEGTIEDADPPEVFVDNVSATEGDPLTFTVALCDPFPGEDVTVDYSTASRSATAGLDFTAASGTLTFLDTDSADSQVSAQCGTGAAESKSQTVSVATLNDIIAESDEEAHLVLSGQTPSHIALGKAVGVGQIVNRNPATVRVSDASAQEGDDLDFEITLEDGSGNPRHHHGFGDGLLRHRRRHGHRGRRLHVGPRRFLLGQAVPKTAVVARVLFLGDLLAGRQPHPVQPRSRRPPPRGGGEHQHRHRGRGRRDHGAGAAARPENRQCRPRRLAGHRHHLGPVDLHSHRQSGRGGRGRHGDVHGGAVRRRRRVDLVQRAGDRRLCDRRPHRHGGLGLHGARPRAR